MNESIFAYNFLCLYRMSQNSLPDAGICILPKKKKKNKAKIKKTKIPKKKFVFEEFWK